MFSLIKRRGGKGVGEESGSPMRVTDISFHFQNVTLRYTCNYLVIFEKTFKELSRILEQSFANVPVVIHLDSRLVSCNLDKEAERERER